MTSPDATDEGDTNATTRDASDSRPPSSTEERSILQRLRDEVESEDTDLHEFIDRIKAERGQVAGRTIGIPFLLLTGSACAISCIYMFRERPIFAGFTLCLYGAVWFLGNAYREAWQFQNFVRQFLAMVIVCALLSGLALIHADDASSRVIYDAGTRILRDRREIFFAAAIFDVVAALILTIHGLGLGFGSRVYDTKSGTRLSHNVAREVYELARERISEAREHMLGEDEDNSGSHESVHGDGEVLRNEHDSTR